MSLVKRQYDDFIWPLKYRPTKVADIALPVRFRTQFQGIVDSKQIPNMVFCGPRGCGKTTTAFCIADEIGCDVRYINMSKDNSIDFIRSELTKFAMSMAFEEGKKLIIGDEFDRLSINAIDALKADIEQCSKNCTFIFISNNKQKYVDHPAMSRMQEIDFEFDKEETKLMKKQFFKSFCIILKKENVKFEKKAAASLVTEYFPDMRKCLNEAQKIAAQFGAQITEESLKAAVSVAGFEMLYSAMADNDFGFVRSFVSDLSVDPTRIYGMLFKSIGDHIEEAAIPQAIVTIADYQYKSHFSLDRQIPLTACISQLMMECEFKGE